MYSVQCRVMPSKDLPVEPPTHFCGEVSSISSSTLPPRLPTPVELQATPLLQQKDILRTIRGGRNQSLSREGRGRRGGGAGGGGTSSNPVATRCLGEGTNTTVRPCTVLMYCTNNTCTAGLTIPHYTVWHYSSNCTINNNCCT